MTGAHEAHSAIRSPRRHERWALHFLVQL